MRVVIKLGGASLENQNTLTELVTLIEGLREKKYKITLVHGGGPAINQELTKRNIEWKFINGQRQTTLEMMEVIEDVLGSKINSMIVDAISQAGIAAKGISGADDILLCSQSNAELMQVGQIEKVNTQKIEEALIQGIIPVVAPIGIGSENERYNINADWAAAQIAIALKVDTLIFLTDQDGILDHNKNLIPIATKELIENLIENGTISGGMYTKVQTMMTALNLGVKQVRVLNAHNSSRLLDHPLMGTLLISSNTEREGASNVSHE